jgi:protoporphyrinogen oxidase
MTSEATPGAPKHVVILGAGPAGLAVGHEFTAQGGGQVTVVERNSYVGGLCVTIKNAGFKFDIGGHRWFTKNEDLNVWFRRLMEGEIVMVDRISRIFHQGKFFKYPISILDIAKNTNPLTILHAGFSFVAVTLRQAVSPMPILNMKDAYTAQFGSKLYEMFFEQYSEKVWGKPCDELSADWVSQRSQGLSIATLIRDTLLRPKAKAVSLIEQFMYPRDGYVRIPERMAEDIQARGGQVLLNSPVARIVCHGAHDFEVFYGESGSVRGEAIVSTIPLGVLAQIIEPKCDESVIRAAKALKFRDLITINLRLKRKQVTPDTWLYVQDKDIIFGRIHEPKNWSKAMVPDDDHTSLVLECFCARGDDIWSMKDEEIADRCISDLVNKLRFIDRSEVVGFQAVRTVQAYPVYDMDYQKNIATVMDFLNTMPGLHVVGRGGSFRYNNADHSIEMGLLLGRRLLGYTVDHMAVNTEQEYHEIKRGDEIGRDHYTIGPAAKSGEKALIVD